MKAKCNLSRSLDGRSRKAGDERIVDAVETGSRLPGADRALFARKGAGILFVSQRKGNASAG